MTHRTTFAFDEGTATHIKSLAKLWKVSQAEVVRRAVSLAEKPATRPDPVALLQQLHNSGEGLSAKAAKHISPKYAKTAKSGGAHDLPRYPLSDSRPHA